MRNASIENILILPFTTEIAKLSPEEFVREILVDRLHARYVLVGENFRFGYQQAGDVQSLAALGRRFGFDVDEETFSQQSPEKAMQSIAKALDRKKVDYLLAHIADPAFVDYWVNHYKVDFTQGSEEGKRLLAFERLVTETNLYYGNDPLILRDLRKFAKEAKWAEEGDKAVGTVEGIAGRKVYLRKIGERWFLENKQQ